jgi:hypothetical protein
MHSLAELRDFLLSKEINVKEFNGWQLKVGKDVWTLNQDDFYLNGEKQSLKQKGLFDKYTKVDKHDNQSTQTRKWRGINCSNRRGK